MKKMSKERTCHFAKGDYWTWHEKEQKVLISVCLLPRFLKQTWTYILL